MKLLEDHLNILRANSKLYRLKRSTIRSSFYVIDKVWDENPPPSGVLALEYFGSVFIEQIYDGFGVNKCSLGIDLYFAFMTFMTFLYVMLVTFLGSRAVCYGLHFQDRFLL